jgi:lipopolysaccharide export system permease protein
MEGPCFAVKQIMSIINRHIAIEILKFFIMILVGVVVIYLVVDFFEKLDNFVEAQVAGQRIALFFLLNIPFVIYQIAPLAVLLAVLVVFGLMNKHSEIIALRAGGISHFSILKPAVAVGLVFSAALFLFADIMVPMTMEKANKIWLEEVRKKELVTTRRNNVWLRGKQQLTKIKRFRPERKTIYSVTIYKFDDQFKLISRLDARMGIYRDDHWQLKNIMLQERPEGTTEFTTTFLSKMNADIDIDLEDFQQVVKQPLEMRFTELLTYIQDLESEGHDASTNWVDLHAKISFPLVCLILTMIGAGLILRPGDKEGLPIKIAMGLGIAFLYWILHSFFVSLGYGGVLFPILAAWMTNIIFAGVSALLLLTGE